MKIYVEHFFVFAYWRCNPAALVALCRLMMQDRAAKEEREFINKVDVLSRAQRLLFHFAIFRCHQVCCVAFSALLTWSVWLSVAVYCKRQATAEQQRTSEKNEFVEPCHKDSCNPLVNCLFWLTTFWFLFFSSETLEKKCLKLTKTCRDFVVAVENDKESAANNQLYCRGGGDEKRKRKRRLNLIYRFF